MKHSKQRRALLAAARKLVEQGLSPGTSGNLSVRIDGGMLLTPTGMDYAALQAEDLVEVRDDGTVPPKQRAPSSEWRIHRDLYAARSGVGAVVHTHSMFCTTLSMLRRPIPAVHYMIAVAGAAVVPCAEYATYGTKELSEACLRAIAESNACLLANHGMVAVGAELGQAMKVAFEVELLAEQYWRALQVGQPHVLEDAEIKRVMETFQTYGQQKPRRG